jgi:hypothetical protein
LIKHISNNLYSSYCFFRDDHRVICNSHNVDWQMLIRNLLNSEGVSTENLVYEDLIKSKNLDTFFVQRISKGYKRWYRNYWKNNALKEMAEKHPLVSLFEGVNVLHFILGAIGADVYFMTSGILQVKVVQSNALPVNNLLSNIGTVYAQCDIRGAESKTMVLDNWWSRPQKTRPQQKAPNVTFNDCFTLYVTDEHAEYLHIELFSTNIVGNDNLGEVELELDGCIPNVKYCMWLPLFKKGFTNKICAFSAGKRVYIPCITDPAIQIQVYFKPHRL